MGGNGCEKEKVVCTSGVSNSPCGMGSPVGTVIAALTIGLIETLVAGYIGFFLPRDAIAFVALIILLLVKPEGLMGKKA